jgi:molybdopterin/thiamine biosynthesis adenylyltransferase
MAGREIALAEVGESSVVRLQGLLSLDTPMVANQHSQLRYRRRDVGPSKRRHTAAARLSR